MLTKLLQRLYRALICTSFGFPKAHQELVFLKDKNKPCTSYCWWKTTSLYGKYPIIYRASFLLFPTPLYILQKITNHEIPRIHSNIFGVQKFIPLRPEYVYILNFKCHNWPTDCVCFPQPKQPTTWLTTWTGETPPLLTLCVGVIMLGKWPSCAHGWIHENDLSKTRRSWAMRSVQLLNNR